MNNELNDLCPNCGETMEGYDCFSCGYCSLEMNDNEYETPQGNIVHCTEEEAFDNGYIHICPECMYNIITWWEMEDHGKCIECWHSDRIQD